MKTSVHAFFKNMQKDDKKTVLKFELKGDVTERQMMNLMAAAGNIVDIQVSSPQMDIDDIHDDERTEAPKVPAGEQVTIDQAMREAETGAAEAAAGSEDAVDAALDKSEDDGKPVEIVDDGEPSEDEKEIESREKEVYQEERDSDPLDEVE